MIKLGICISLTATIKAGLQNPFVPVTYFQRCAFFKKDMLPGSPVCVCTLERWQIDREWIISFQIQFYVTALQGYCTGSWVRLGIEESYR